MNYISTSGKYRADLRHALSECYAPDGTLYLPERLPTIPRAIFNNIEEMSVREIGYVVAASLLGDDIDRAKLKSVVDSTFIYDIPFKTIDGGLNVMELFEGPTMAFKDFSAQFVANFIDQHQSAATPRVAMVATTGNTGGAVANAFMRHKDHHVVVLYPKGALSRMQIAQFTTVGPNVHAIEVAGDISSCKKMACQAIADESLRPLATITSLNTANYLRIVPKVVFFFYAYSRLRKLNGATIANNFSPSIPCGNLSTLVSAIIAKRMGLPMGRIIAGCSSNDDLVRVLSGELAPEHAHTSSRATLARAMDAGYPTNMGRMLRLYNNDIARAAADIRAYSLGDGDIAEIINRHLQNGYTADPHTAVAIGAAEKGAAEGVSSARGTVVFATAHPAKSLNTMNAITGRSFELPLQLTSFMASGCQPVKMPPSYAALRKYLISHHLVKE